MKNILKCAAIALFVQATPSFAASYMPVGPQTNVALSTVTDGGWSLCYSAAMGTEFGTSASTAVAACTGDLIMLAGRETGSNTLLALAAAPKVDALFNTGVNTGTTHLANGAEWYNADNYSWGFAPAGQSVNKFECDGTSGTGRICLHTLAGIGGYRINNILGLNGSTAYEKLVFSASSSVGAVPEPATWAMMIAGFGMVGAGLRRRTRTAIQFA